MEWVTEDPMPMTDLYTYAAEQGFSHGTVFNAVKTLVRLGRLEEGREKNPSTGRMRNVIAVRSFNGAGVTE
jgi:hypothetical protein